MTSWPRFEATGSAEVVCVTVAGSMSGANHEAAMAAERFAGRVEIVDSLSASMAEGFVALTAARAAADGATLDEVADRGSRGRGRGSPDRDREHVRTPAAVGPGHQAPGVRGHDARPQAGVRVPGRRARRPWPGPGRDDRALDRVVEETVAETGGRPLHMAALHAGAEAEARAVADRIHAAGRRRGGDDRRGHAGHRGPYRTGVGGHRLLLRVSRG